MDVKKPVRVKSEVVKQTTVVPWVYTGGDEKRRGEVREVAVEAIFDASSDGLAIFDVPSGRPILGHFSAGRTLVPFTVKEDTLVLSDTRERVKYNDEYRPGFNLGEGWHVIIGWIMPCAKKVAERRGLNLDDSRMLRYLIRSEDVPVVGSS